MEKMGQNNMSKTTGAKLLVECLLKQEVKYIFAIPGAKIDGLFDALLDSPIKVIVCRHEQNAAFIAGIYGRITGKPGVVLVTSGPGVSNLATGLLTATTEGDPIVAIGGNVSRAMKFKESHQNTDNIKLMEAVTKFHVEIPIVDSIPEIIENAFRHAVRPRSGAVFISVPQDILFDTTEVKANEVLEHFQYGSAPDHLLLQAAKYINEAKRPILLLGMEASRGDNTAAIRKLLKTTPLATICTYQASGVISRDLLHCFVGRVGLFKNQPGDQLIDNADLVITVGFNPVEYDPEIWNSNQSKKIIHISYNPVNVHTAYSPKLELLGNIATTIDKLTPNLTPNRKFEYENLVHDLQHNLEKKINSGEKLNGKRMHPLRFIYDLRHSIGDDITVISDIGTHYMWMARYFFSYQAHRLLFSNGQQTLGVALPWAIGTHFARPGEKIISISGDGGFLFSATELETAVREKIHFVHCVWCDGKYDMVYEQQMMKYKRNSAVHFGPVDIVKFAESFGAHGFKVNESDEFSGILKKAMTLEGPVLIEIPIDYSDNKELFASSYENIGH